MKPSEIKKLRKALGFSLSKFANEIGITWPTALAWETKKVSIRSENFKKLEKFIKKLKGKKYA